MSPPGLPQHDGDTMDHFLVCFVTARPSAAWWWHHGAIYGLLFHCEAFPNTIATLWTIFWSFVLSQGLPRHNGDTIGHFLIFVSLCGLPQQDGDTMDHFWIFCVTVRPSLRVIEHSLLGKLPDPLPAFCTWFFFVWHHGWHGMCRQVVFYKKL